MTSQGATAPSSPAIECCMCGDYGLPYELLRCKVCLVRFQHRYCSNLYPKAESYQVCNWCLKTKGGNSSLSSTNNKEDNKNKKNNSSYEHVGLKVQRGSLQFHLQNPIKKQLSLDQPLPRKKIIPNDCKEETLRRAKSVEKPNTGITKQVFRGKVRRYKLLDEVSS